MELNPLNVPKINPLKYIYNNTCYNLAFMVKIQDFIPQNLVGKDTFYLDKEMKSS